MSVFKSKEFARFARREGIADDKLREAAERAQRGLVDADLGGGLIKQRVARQGQGRSGGFRTLMAFRREQKTVFLYGFAKSERENIGPDELDFWRQVAGAMVAMPPAQWQVLLAEGEIVEVGDD